MQQGLGCIGAAGVASLNRVRKLSHIRSEPASSSSKMLAKAKSVSNVGFYSVRANIRNLKQTNKQQ